MPRRQVVLALVLSTLILASVVGYLGIGAYVYGQVTATVEGCGAHDENEPDAFWVHLYDGSRSTFNTTPFHMNGTETVRIDVPDEDVELDAWWKAGEEGMPAVIVVHGIRSCKRNHEVLLPASMLSDAGYSVLMLTLRENGDSTRIDGQFDGGITEYRDIIGAWSWINATHGVPSDRIGAVGGSGGAAIVAWAMHNEPGITAGFLDSSWYDFERLMDEELAHNGFPSFLGPAAIRYGILATGEDLTSNPPSALVQDVGDRSIFIHGNVPDQRIRVHHAHDLWSVANASVSDAGFVDGWISDVTHPESLDVGPYDHLVSMFVASDRYRTELVGFFDTAFGLDPTIMRPG